MRIRIEVLGGFRVSADGREVPEIAAQPARATVLALTAVRGEITREETLGLLWPERDPGRARHALNQNIHRLRGTLGQNWILVEGERLRISPDTWVDSTEFERMAQEGRFAEAGELYRGPLLHGWFLGNGSTAFQHWVDGERVRLERLLRKTQRQHLEELLEEHRLEEALQVAQGWVRVDPLEDEAQHALIELLFRCGSRDDALAQFSVYSDLLRAEGLEPLEETRGMVGRIRNSTAGENGHLAATTNGTGSRKPTPFPGSAEAAGKEGSLLRLPSIPRWSGLPPSLSTALGAAGLLILALILLGGGGLLLGRLVGGDDPPPGPFLNDASIPRVVVADFTSTPEDRQLATVASEILRVDLQQHLGLAVLGSAEMAEALGRMRRDPSLPLGVPQALELAEREGLDLVVDGGISQAAGSLVLTARIMDPSTREVREAFRVIAENEEGFIDALGELSRQLTEEIASGYTLLSGPPGLEQVTTSSLEALRKYSLAQRVWAREGNALQALGLLEEAVEIDPEFAMAYRSQAAILQSAGLDRNRQVQALRQAFLNSRRLPEAERLFTVGTYHLGATGDLDAAIRAFGSLLAARPRDLMALNNLALIHLSRANWEEAARLASRCVDLAPSFPQCHLNLALARHRGGNLEGGRRVLTEAKVRFPNNPTLTLAQLQFAVGERAWNRVDSLATLLESQAPDSPNWRGRIGIVRGQILAVRGRIEGAEEQLREVARLAEQEGAAEDFIEARLTQAGIRLRVLGDTVAALEGVRTLMNHPMVSTLPPLEYPYHPLAELLLLAHRPQEVEDLMARFSQEVPTVNQGLFQGSQERIRGLLALEAGEVDVARDILDRAGTGYALALSTLQYLPLVEEAEGDSAGALEAYQAYVDTPFGNRLRFDALALGPYLQRIIELQLAGADSVQAGLTIQRLEDLWGDADPALRSRVASLEGRIGQAGLVLNPGSSWIFLLLP